MCSEASMHPGALHALMRSFHEIRGPRHALRRPLHALRDVFTLSGVLPCAHEGPFHALRGPFVRSWLSSYFFVSFEKKVKGDPEK